MEFTPQATEKKVEERNLLGGLTLGSLSRSVREMGIVTAITRAIEQMNHELADICVFDFAPFDEPPEGFGDFGGELPSN